MEESTNRSAFMVSCSYRQVFTATPSPFLVMGVYRWTNLPKFQFVCRNNLLSFPNNSQNCRGCLCPCRKSLQSREKRLSGSLLKIRLLQDSNSELGTGKNREDQTPEESEAELIKMMSSIPELSGYTGENLKSLAISGGVTGVPNSSTFEIDTRNGILSMGNSANDTRKPGPREYTTSYFRPKATKAALASTKIHPPPQKARSPHSSCHC